MSEKIALTAAEKKKVIDTLFYPDDIAPYQCIHLWAGVGAGKNWFVENIMNGNADKSIPKLTVLLISSRKSKIAETLNTKQLDVCNHMTNSSNRNYIKANFPQKLKDYTRTVLVDGILYEIIQRSVVCTNAYIEKYHKNYYDPQDPQTHLWNRFDLIVWDEAHALTIDSTYQTSPPHVINLLHESYRRMKKRNTDQKDAIFSDFISPRCDKLMIMTGTPEPIEDEIILPKPHLLDLRQPCINIMPANIIFLDSLQARNQICRQLSEGARIIYFSNQIKDPDTIADLYHCPKDKIAVSFSEEKKRRELKAKDPQDTEQETDYKRMINVEDHLAACSHLRSDISLFYTTSRNKEGINIEDDDIHHLYIESHSMTDIRQMAGRIRRGVKNLYIITDAPATVSKEHFLETDYARLLCCNAISSSGKMSMSAINSLLEEHCARFGVYNLIKNKKMSAKSYISKHPRIGYMIDLITNKHPYVTYNYFLNTFEYNKYREHGNEFIRSELEAFNNAVDNSEQLIELFRRFFPNSNINFVKSRFDEACELGQQFLQSNSGKYISEEELWAFVNQIDALISTPATLKRRKGKTPQPNDILHKIGLKCSRRSHNKSRAGYSQYYIKEYQPTNKAA